MKFSCDSKALAYGLNKCTYIARVSRTYATSRAVKIRAIDDGFGSLELTATDMSTTVTYYVTDVDIEETGEVLVDARSFASFASAKEARLSAHTTPTGKLSVNGGGNRILLSPIVGYFPEDEALPAMPMARINGDALDGLMSIAFMAKEEAAGNSQLAGTYVIAESGRLTAVATSGFRVGYAWADIEMDGKITMLLPPVTGKVLPSFVYPDDVVSVYLTERNHVAFVTGRFKLVSAELAGKEKYPFEGIKDWALKKQEHTVTVDRDDFKGAIENCLVMAEGESNEALRQMTFSPNEESARLLNVSTSSDSQIGHMVMTVGIEGKTGKDFVFTVNARFAKDVLRAIDKLAGSAFVEEFAPSTKSVVIGFSEETNWIYMSSDRLPAVFIIAPIKEKTHLV